MEGGFQTGKNWGALASIKHTGIKIVLNARMKNDLGSTLSITALSYL